MSIIRSLQASAAFLSFCTVSRAWVLHHKNNANVQNEGNLVPLELRANSFDQRQETVLDCSEDQFQDLLNSNPPDRVMTFCNEWLGMAPATVVTQITPTITITTASTSTTTTTSTTRTIVTMTTTQTATTTLPPVTLSAGMQARAVNIVAVAEDIIASVIVSGTESQPASTVNEQQKQAASGLANACSCRMVEPMTTVTSSFTVPPVYTTVGVRRIIIMRVTETSSFTAMVTMTETPAPINAISTSSVVQTSSVAASNGAESSLSSATIESITTAPTATRLSSGISLTDASSTDSAAPVVTGIPFNCPADANKRADQIVDDFKFEYLVLCNTEIITRDRVGAPITTDDENSCTAQCSVLNSQSGQTSCQSATFTPFTDGRKGGLCVLNGKEVSYAEKPGAISVVNTRISSNGDECAAIDEAADATKSIDTSALVASITSVGISLSTPGLITQTADGGVFETYVSANSTDANGYIHWSWYRVSASSSYWWGVYGTSWACSRTLTQTIVQQPPTTAAPEATISAALETTIINGDTTTIISGSSTRTIFGGGGVAPPTFVPASVTSGNGEFTTIFSEATATSTGSGGLIPPTGALANVTISRGSIDFNVSFATLTFFSTMSEGIITPSASPVISSPSANNSAIATSNSTQIASSGSTFVLDSTSDGGVIPPSPTNGSAVFTTSSATTTVTSAGGNGGYGPQSSSTNQTYLNSTSGAADITIAGSSIIVDSTGSSGIITPSLTTGNPSTPTAFVSSGDLNVTMGSSTFVVNSTGSYVIPLASSNATTPSLPTTPPGNDITESAGRVTLSTYGSNATTFSTGDSDVIPPANTGTPSANVSSTEGNQVSSIQESTSTPTFTGESGVTGYANSSIANPPSGSPLPDLNVSATDTFSNPDYNRSKRPFSTLSTANFTVPFSSSVTVPPSGTPTLSLNILTTDTLSNSISDGLRSSFPLPSSSSNNPINLTTVTTTMTLPVPTPELTSSTTGNVTTVPPFGNSTVPSGTGFTIASIVSSLSANSTIPVTQSNANFTSVPSVTSSVSLNSTVHSGTGFTIASTSTAIPSLSVNSTVLVTQSNANFTSIPSVTSSVSLNSTVPSGAGFTIASTSTTVPSLSVNSTVLVTQSNANFTSIPSVMPSVSLNSTTTLTSYYGNSTGPSPTTSVSRSLPILCAKVPVTVTEVSVSTQVVTTTVLQIQTVTADSAASSIVASVSSAAAAVSDSPVNVPLNIRTAGEAATQEQIDAACSSTGNIVVNPDFAKRADATVPGWSVDASDPNITVDSIDDQVGNNTTARFSSAVAGSPLTITQPLTLCPGAQYSLSARTRQANELARCNVGFVISTDDQQKSVLEVAPQAGESTKSAIFTAGSSNADAAVDLKITARCDGYQGFPVSDDEGWMRVEVGGVKVSKDA